jgi:CBS domain-containing protein
LLRPAISNLYDSTFIFAGRSNLPAIRATLAYIELPIAIIPLIEFFRNFNLQNIAIMKSVSAVLRRKGASIVSVSPSTPVAEALKIMAEKNIGSVVVMENDRYLGIMTERDYSRKVILKGRNSTDTLVSEIMSDDLPSVKPSDTIDHCMELMTNLNIRYMPVYDSNKLAGIISMTDVVKETILAQKETIDHLQSYIQS